MNLGTNHTAPNELDRKLSNLVIQKIPSAYSQLKLDAFKVSDSTLSLRGRACHFARDGQNFRST